MTEDRQQVPVRRTAAPAVADVEVGRTGPFIRRTVGIVDDRDTELTGTRDHGPGQRMQVAAALDAQRPARAPQLAVACLPVLAAPEVRQAVAERPTRGAGGRPRIVVPRIAAIPHHGIDGAGSAQHLAARQADDPLADPRRRRVVVAPVIGTAAERHPGGRRLDFRHVETGNPGFDQQHRRRAAFDEAACHDAAAGSGTDDDVVVLRGERWPQLCSLGPMITMPSLASTWRTKRYLSSRPSLCLRLMSGSTAAATLATTT